MARNRLLLAVSVVICLTQLTLAQTTPVCASKIQSSMTCVIPQVYGPTGLTLDTNTRHNAHFEGQSFTALVLPVTVSVGTELALRSIASPASGVLFTFDKSLGTVTRSSESYGPILTERAETVGRHRVFLATTYEFLNFSSLDGISLKHLPITLSHAQFHAPGLPATDYVPCPGAATGCPIYAKDFISTQDRIDLKAHEFTLYATYGLTNRIDVSVAIPILNVRLGITSSATVNRESPQPVSPVTDLALFKVTGQTATAATDPTCSTTTPNLTCFSGFFHYFNINDPLGSTNKVFSNFKSSSGIGDVVFRAKGTVWKGEHTRVALGLDVRTPTGDEQNFLGSGAVGVKPFLAASYGARVSPHVNLGFEYNGQSILAGQAQNNVLTGASGKLPNEFFYSGGVDAGLSKRLTVAADLLGTRLSSSGRIRTVPYVDPIGAAGGIAYAGVSQLAIYRDAINMVDISLGAKYSPFGNFLLTGNVLFKANNSGLRAKVVPLVGASYSF